MSDLSNPTGRVLDVIKLLASQPNEDFSLADIAQQTGMSKASAHRVLLTMTAADFLARHPRRRTYSLGMGLLAVGQASLERYRGVEAAKIEMARMSAELGVQCSATALIGRDLIILACDGLPKSHAGFNRVGERRPMIPPMGLCHVAWGRAALVEPYLAFAKQHMRADAYAWLLEALPLIRQRGYAMATASWHRLGSAVVVPAAAQRDSAHWATVCELVAELNRDEIQLAAPGDGDIRQIGQIAAPVFAPDASMAFQLVLSGLPATLTARKLERCIERLLAAAVAVTDQMNGSVPAGRDAVAAR
nr:helix-turn-helix domain-containing protein [Solimonas terrae]